MREIRFRAWDKKYKEMLSPDHLWKCTFYLCPCNGTFNAYGVDPDAPDDKDKEGMGENENLIPMQYTGLKDKNGQDIYEGDILKCTDHIAPVQYGHYDSYCGMGLSVMGHGFHVSKNERTPFMIGENCEIIGNIYENPELIPK